MLRKGVLLSGSKPDAPFGVSRFLRLPAQVLAASEARPAYNQQEGTAMVASLERLARNQALFREVNERLLELSDGFQDGSMTFVCECSNDDCTATVTMTREDYESVRARATLFVVLTGHELLEVEDVVDRRDGFTVVEKTTGRYHAVETDPRRHGSKA
jgi:hypothetical protein